MVRRGRTFIEGTAREMKTGGGGGEARRELLMVSHGGFIRTVLAGVCGVDDPEEIRNTSLSEVDVYDLASGGLGYDVRCIGDTSHLSDDLQSASKW